MGPGQGIGSGMGTGMGSGMGIGKARVLSTNSTPRLLLTNTNRNRTSSPRDRYSTSLIVCDACLNCSVAVYHTIEYKVGSVKC